MTLPLAMPRLCRKPIDHNDPPIIEDRTRPAATDAALEFGRYRVLLRQRRLLAGGVPVELGARAFEILMVLIEADGALVIKDELQRRVWPDVVVAPENLKAQIAVLRKALGEDRGLILTDHGRGYRFIGTIRDTLATAEGSPASGATMPRDRRNAASATDSPDIASRLTRAEARLAVALRLLETGRNVSRLPRRRYTAGRSTRRTRRHGRLASECAAWVREVS
jgi:DNA-binding winged helix-turn-helix (wHTH) protein